MTMPPIVVQGIPVALEERGEGRSIPLIHGWSADHERWLVDELRRSMNCMLA